jgi:hypothetical protein
MANKPNEFPVFSHVDKNTVERMVTKIIKLLGNLSTVESFVEEKPR